MIKGTEIRSGMVIRVKGELYSVLKMDHVTPGKGRAHIQTKLRSLSSGNTSEMRFSSNDKIDNLMVENKTVEYLYSDQQNAVFMDPQDFDNVEIPLDSCREELQYLVPNAKCTIQYIDGRPMSIELPAAVELEVEVAPPAVKGDTATNVTKTCTTETGLEVKIPAHINEGDIIKVDTRSGDFIERVNK